MKREILFKGKLSHSKEWIEGNLIIAQNGKPYIIPFEIFKPDGHNLIIDSDNFFWVNEDSVCQFINQTDKNGKRIFEGDFDDDGNCIVWCDNCNGFEFAQLDVPTKDICISCHRCDGNFFFDDHINDFEIVGNVADKVSDNGFNMASVGHRKPPEIIKSNNLKNIVCNGKN